MKTGDICLVQGLGLTLDLHQMESMLACLDCNCNDDVIIRCDPD